MARDSNEKMTRVQEAIMSRLPPNPKAGDFICASHIVDAWQETSEEGVPYGVFKDDIDALFDAGCFEEVRHRYYRLTPAGENLLS